MSLAKLTKAELVIECVKRGKEIEDLRVKLSQARATPPRYDYRAERARRAKLIAQHFPDAKSITPEMIASIASVTQH